MKSRLTFLAIVLAILGLFVCLGMPNTGCTQQELSEWVKHDTVAASQPTPVTIILQKTEAATTQAIERTEEAADKVTKAAEPIANNIAAGAGVAGPIAAGIGLPQVAGLLGGASLVFGAIGKVLGAYNERRKGTIPAQAAAKQATDAAIQLSNAWHDETTPASPNPGASPAHLSILNTIASTAPAIAAVIEAALPTAKSS